MNVVFPFPHSLFQPMGSFRFSTDALLLAEFAVFCMQQRACLLEIKPIWRFLDLGTGCGVVGLAFLSSHETAHNWFGVGLDIHTPLLHAAQYNSVSLGFDKRFAFVQADVTHCPLPENSQHLVLANPPWRLLHAARPSRSLLRRDALFGQQKTLHNFAEAAAKTLINGGLYCSIVHCDAQNRQEAALNAVGFYVEQQKVCPPFILYSARKAIVSSVD